MVEAAQRPSSPFLYRQPSPLSFSLVLSDQRAAKANQTVPISPSLSPLARHSLKRSDSASSLLPALSSVNRGPRTRNSPSPALVPECNSDKVFSGSPLLRQILRAGRKRQLESGSPADSPSHATPSPIATSSKRFCSHCCSTYSSGTGMVVLSRSNQNTPPAKGLNQVVPSYSPAAAEGDENKCPPRPQQPSTNKDGVKLLELFAGDIFANHED